MAGRMTVLGPLVICAALVVSCAERPREAMAPTTETSAPWALEPQAVESSSEPVFVELVVPDHEPAMLSLPAGAEREPLLVAAHGAGDGPRWQCEVWRDIVGARGAILCPAGRRLGGGYEGYYFPDHHQLEKIVLAAVEAAERAYPERIDTASIIYTGYSQGATMGALMVVDHAARFPRLALVEGGFSQWNVQRGREFKRRGGDRVLFACGTRHCATRAERSTEWLEKAGIAADLVDVPRGGHTYGGAVAVGLAEAFAWLVDGDARWQGHRVPSSR